MRFIISFLLVFTALISSAQEMFMQPVKLSNNDSVSINVSEVYVVYENTNGSAKVIYSYPNSVIELKTDYDDLVDNSCGNLVSITTNQNGINKRMAFNPQFVYRVYRISGRTKIQIRNTNQIFDSPQSFSDVSALLGNCGAASAVSIDSVTVSNDTICFYYNDATFDCFELTDTTTTANWYTTNGSTTDSLRRANIIKTALWYGMDTTGFIRHQVGLLDGSRITVFQDSAVVMKFGADATNYVSVGRDRINIVTSGDEGAINLRSDTINFFDKYLFANAAPTSTNGIMSFHYWRGNGTNTTPGFTTMSVLADSIDNYINVTADNGITENVHNNFRLGGSLVQTTTISAGSAYQLIIDGSIPTSTAKGTLRVNNTSAASVLDAAIYGVANAGRGVEGISTSGIGVLGTGNWGVYGTSSVSAGLYGVGNSSANGLYASSVSGTTAALSRQDASTNSVLSMLSLTRSTTGTAADGIGASITFDNETSNGSVHTSNTIVSKWSGATDSVKTSQFILSGVDTSVTKDIVTVNGGGSVLFNQYGDGFFIGTVSKVAGWDINGKFLEMSMSQLSDSVGSYILEPDSTIYTVDGTVANRTIEVNGPIDWLDADGDGEFNVSMGDVTSQGNLFVTGVETKINHVDAVGISTVVADGNGVEISTTDVSNDNIVISASGIVELIGDSIVMDDIELATELPTILGITGINTIKKLDGGNDGDVITWDSVAAVWTSSPSSYLNIYNSNGTIGTNRTASITDNLNFVNNSAASGERFNVTFDNGVSSTNFLRVQEGTGILLQSSENIISLEGATALSDVLSPTSLASNTDNYTGLNGSNFGRLSASPGVNLTGIANGRPGRILPFFNVGNSYITLKDNATSTAGNRFQMATDVNLKTDDGALFIYDSVSLRHRLLSTNIGSLYTGSGQLLNGRSGSLYARYMLDTLNDFALGYFTNGTSDDKTTYGKFGLHMDGDGGFSVAAKETYIKGAGFNLLGTSYVAARQNYFDLYGVDRLTVGGTQNFSQLVGNPISSYFLMDHGNTEVYNTISLGMKKDHTGIPSNRKDYGFLYQGGGMTGSDTSAISVWWGTPQISDTVSSITSGDVRAVSSNRGFGVQSLFDYNAGGIAASLKYDWLKIKTGSIASDTTLDGITFYNGSYEIPNDIPSSAAGDTSIMVWASPTNSFFIDKSTFCCGATGSGENIYNTDDLLKAGGTTVGLDSGSLKFNLATTAAATVYGIEMTADAATGSNRFLSMKTAVDSARFQESAGDYLLIVSSDFQLNVSDQTRLVHDSLQIADSGIESKNKIRSLWGSTPSGWLKRFDGDAQVDGTIPISNATDWTMGELRQHEANVPGTIRPSQLTAQQNDWSPTGFSTTKSQIIEVSGDASFRFITGMTAATRDGVTKTLDNTGTDNCIGIAKQHTSSSAANRFIQEIILLPGMSATFRYDSVGQRWRLLSTTKDEVTFNNIYEHNAKTVGLLYANDFWNLTTNGGTSTPTSASSTLPIGRNELGTSTAATAWPTIQGRTGLIYIASNKTYISLYARVRIEDLSSTTEDFDIRFGFKETVDTNITRGAYISYQREENSGGWTLKTHDGATLTTTNCGSAIAADTWYDIEIIYYPYGEVVVYIDDVRYSTTSTLPSGTRVLPFLQIDKDNGTTARNLYWNQIVSKLVYVSDTP